MTEDKTTNVEQPNTTIQISKVDHRRIMAIADPEHRNARQQVLCWLDAHEALAVDMTPEIQAKKDTIKNLRPAAPEEGKGG